MMGSPRGKALYTGVTNDLLRRVREHKSEQIEGFTKRYKCHNLLYYEEYWDVRDAIAREKQLKRWRRDRKEELIRTINPERKDLAE